MMSSTVRTSLPILVTIAVAYFDKDFWSLVMVCLLDDLGRALKTQMVKLHLNYRGSIVLGGTLKAQKGKLHLNYLSTFKNEFLYIICILGSNWYYSLWIFQKLLVFLQPSSHPFLCISITFFTEPFHCISLISPIRPLVSCYSLLLLLYLLS